MLPAKKPRSITGTTSVELVIALLRAKDLVLYKDKPFDRNKIRVRKLTSFTNRRIYFVVVKKLA